jgi:general secretion pathway protein G
MMPTSACCRRNNFLIESGNTMKQRNRSYGFTLIEMLVVLVIIGLLAGLVGPKLFSKVDTSKVQTAQTQVKMLKGALETMRLDIGTFPSTEDGLAMLNDPPKDEKLRAKWKGPYLDEALPNDPWGNPYQYSVPGSNGQPFALYSFGADGKKGGEGNDADIGMLPPQ